MNEKDLLAKMRSDEFVNNNGVVLRAVNRGLSEEDLKSSDPIKLVKQATELVRAVSYKRNLDIKNKEMTEMGFDAVKEKLFTALERDDPELYGKLAEYINAKKEELAE